MKNTVCVKSYFRIKEVNEKMIQQMTQGRFDKLLFTLCGTNIETKKWKMIIFCKHHIVLMQAYFYKIQSTVTDFISLIRYNQHIHDHHHSHKIFATIDWARTWVHGRNDGSTPTRTVLWIILKPSITKKNKNFHTTNQPLHLKF